MKMSRIIVVIVGVIIFLLFAISSNDTETKDSKIKEIKEPFEKCGTKEIKTPLKENTTKKIKAPFEICTDINGLKITITKITNDDLLKIYVKYENNTGSVYSPGECLCKIVADGRQQEADTMKALDFKKGDILYDLENGVTYESILIFDKIKDNKFNLIFNVDYDDVRINDIYI